MERKARLDTCDYLLLVNRKPVEVIEAKRKGTLLSGVAEQTTHYGENLPYFLKTSGILLFLYESTGVETFFRDERDPEPGSRRVFSFHRPETLAAYLAEKSPLWARLAKMPLDHPLARNGKRACQIEGILNLEHSFVRNDPRALIQKATGAGNFEAGCNDSMVLRADGTAIMWGDNEAGETNVPTGLSNVVAM